MKFPNPLTIVHDDLKIVAFVFELEFNVATIFHGYEGFPKFCINDPLK